MASGSLAVVLAVLVVFFHTGLNQRLRLAHDTGGGDGGVFPDSTPSPHGAPPPCARLSTDVPGAEQRCALAWQVCEPEGFVNYVALYHCHSRLLTWPLAALASGALIYLLGDIAEAHFCPSLEFLSKHLDLAPAVAGPTLLAIGNGSPDISSSLIGLVVTPGAQDLGLNSPLGGGLFVISVVVALVVLRTGVVIEPWPFYRDTISYLGAVLLLVYIVSDGLVHLGEATALLSLYAAYVLLVVFGDHFILLAFVESVENPAADAAAADAAPLLMHLDGCPTYFSISIQRAESESEAHGDEAPSAIVAPELGSDDSPRAKNPVSRRLSNLARCCSTLRRHSSVTSSSYSVPSPYESSAALQRMPSGVMDLVEPGTLLHQTLESEGLPEFARAGLYRYFKFRYKRVARHNLLYPGAEGDGDGSVRSHHHVDLVDLTIGDAVMQFLEEDLGWPEHAGWRRVPFLLMFPAKVAFYLTVPPLGSDPAGWRKLWAVTCPIMSPLLLLVVTGFHTPITVLTTVFLGSLGSGIVYLTTHASQPPSWSVVFAAVAFVTSIAWMFLVAREIMGLLEAVGALLAVSQALLAVTVLAWGNCVGDLVADLAMARSGYGTTAVCATYGGPLLTLCVGLGSAFCCQAALHYPRYPLGQVREDVAFCLCTLIACLLFTMVGVPLCRFHPGKLFGVLLLLLYGGFVGSMVAYDRGLLRFDWLPFPDWYCAAPPGGDCRTPRP